MRLFFALWPPRETARALAGWANQVAGLTGGRAVAAENVHLTLAFLGPGDPGKASAAAAEAKGGAFALRIDSSGYWKHNQIVWAGPAALPPELSELVARLHPSLRQGGFVLEDRPFAAHVTLVRKAPRSGQLPPLPDVQWPAREFVLVRSTPAGNGSRYDAIERFPLG